MNTSALNASKESSVLILVLIWLAIEKTVEVGFTGIKELNRIS